MNIGACGFSETHQKKLDGTFQLVPIQRAQCARCGRIGWTPENPRLSACDGQACPFRSWAVQVQVV